jgi:hypothetical protein
MNQPIVQEQESTAPQSPFSVKRLLLGSTLSAIAAASTLLAYQNASSLGFGTGSEVLFLSDDLAQK